MNTLRTKSKRNAPNSVLLKFWGFTGLASLLASVQFPSGDSDGFVNPQISEARSVGGNSEIKKSVMKKTLLGCLLLSIILIVLYSIVWIVHEVRKDTIILSDQEIISLEKGLEELTKDWDNFAHLLTSKFDNEKYLSKKEFIQLLGSLNTSEIIISFLKDIIPDDSTIEICDKTIAFEIFSSSDPYIYFPDNYRHYLSFGEEKSCPTLNSFDGHDIIKDELVGQKLRYKISRHFWD